MKTKVRLDLYGPLLGVWLLIWPGFGIAVAQNEIWLDNPLTNWNTAGARIPKAPKPTSDLNLRGRCGTEVRPATTVGDRLATKMGWRLFGPLLVFGKTSVIRALSDVDGMCRPMRYQIFVFVGEKFAGTLAPSPMNSRADGSATEIHLTSSSRIHVEFARYTPSDPRCCPSRKQYVEYAVERGLVVPFNEERKRAPANTTADEATVPAEGIVTGTVEYRERLVLLPTAQLRVSIFDDSRQDSVARVLAEESFIPAGNFPFNFKVRYRLGEVVPTRAYRLEVNLRSGEHEWENAEPCPVLTNGVSAGVHVMLRLTK